MNYADDVDTKRQVQYIHKLIESRIGFTATRDSLEPRWFRGLSDLQMNAVHGLSENLCDDILEGSTYRVYKQLIRLGLDPRPPERKLHKVFTISRGNDVAFLWFLMEMFYKSNGPDTIYSVNEQIIMSAIFWLDLYPTLRELDRLLPLPHKSAKERRKIFQAEELRIKKAEHRQKFHFDKLHTEPKLPESPYFAKPCPFKYRRRRLISDYPSQQTRSIKIQDEQPNAVIQKRWFADFVFHDGQRVANSVLRREIDNVLMSLKAANVSKNHVESMCVHHQKIKEVEQSLKLKMELYKQQQRSQLLQVGRRHKKRNQQRILQELDRLTEHHLAKFHAMAVKTRIESTRKRLCADLQEPDFIYLGEDVELTEETQQNSEFLPPTCRDNTPEQAEKKDSRQRPSSLMRFLLHGGMEEEKTKTGDKRINFQLVKSSSSSSSPSASTKYFEFSRNHYKFNYRKLFGPGNEKMLNDKNLKLKAEFIKALDEDVEYIHRLLDGDPKVLDACVDRTAKQMFKEGVDIFQQEYEKAEAVLATVKSDPRLDFGLQYYDADNLDQMKEMLKLGLKRVAEDRHYVLPTLPNVHSVPLLVEWIRSRYGKRYSRTESERISDQAMFLMDHLALILQNKIVRQPYQAKIGENSSAGSVNMVYKTTKDRLLKMFSLSIMELGRVFQSMMQNNNSTNATSTYFAYMPAHLRDVDLN